MSTIVWFRQDLRISDNRALAAAHAAGEAVVPVYVHAPAEEGAWAPGAASRWWLHHSLRRLAEDLAGIGSRLILRTGDESLRELLALARACGAKRVVWNRRYEPAAVLRDQQIKKALRDAGLFVDSYNGALLHEPWEIATNGDSPFQVFTPYWRRCLSLPDPPDPQPAPTKLPAPRDWPAQVPLENLDLLPSLGWTTGLEAEWTPGRDGALRRLGDFLRDAFADYKERRNRPDVPGTSRLSPHLHFGEIGPREVWHAARGHNLPPGDAGGTDAGGGTGAWRSSTFLTELGWREFAYHLLFHFPHTAQEPLRAKYARFPWASDPHGMQAWERGRTGYPIVDAGMRELWRTGWMHNRVRMIVASFLVKDLLLPWTAGARWFWDTLVDADLASNTLGWQWAAGCGADAAPYFRIFNPMLQGNKFDPQGIYVRRWVPELAELPNQWLHSPWTAPPEVLRASKVRLGTNYPMPYVDHGVARARALDSLATLKD